MYNHYIRVNENNEVVAGFSNAFQTPEPDDICIKTDSGDRHFNMQLQERGVYKYTWDGSKLVERTATAINMIASPREEEQKTLARLKELDVIIPRALEDLYETLNVTPYEGVKKVVDEKKTLRLKLRS